MRARQLLTQERHPRVALAPRRGAVVESRPRTIERARHDDVADTRAGPFVAGLAREIGTREPPQTACTRLLVVGVHELDAMTVREADDRPRPCCAPDRARPAALE